MNNLGIAVVYLVEEGNERLLELHLKQIERYTRVPYLIYASASRLLPRFRKYLEQHPKLKLCDIPTTALRGTPEHAYYLDRLVRIAVEDGVSHVAVFHVDSFPVRAGWVEELVDRLQDSCVLAAIMRNEIRDHKPNTAGMLFTRDFYLNYRPTFLLSDAERSSPEYQRYLREHEHIPDSGVGYGYAIFVNGLCWHPLLKSNKAQDHARVGAIYSDIFFHLGFAARSNNVLPGSLAALVRRNALLRPLGRLLVPDAVWRGTPGASWRGILRILSWSFGTVYRKNTLDLVKNRLFENPDGYLDYLRTGKLYHLGSK